MSSKSERQKKIIEILNQISTTTTKELATALNVSEMTIRRDVDELSKKDLVNAYYGGITLKYSESSFTSSASPGNYTFDKEKGLHLAEKLRIAKFASTMVQPFDSIAVDNGTTCCNILDYINDNTSCIIYTYSQEVMNRVFSSQKSNFQLFVFGGYYHSDIKMFEYNDILSTIRKMHINKLFLGTVGVSTTYGLSCAQACEVPIRKALIDISDTVVLLADSSKIGKSWFDHYADISDIDIFVTDQGITPEQKQEFENHDIIVHVV